MSDLFEELRADVEMRLKRGDGPRSFVVERAFDAMVARSKKRKPNEANQDEKGLEALELKITQLTTMLLYAKRELESARNPHAANRIAKYLQGLKVNTCKWTEDENGVYDTECDNRFEFTTDGPKENKFKVCPYCGNLLENCEVRP